MGLRSKPLYKARSVNNHLLIKEIVHITGEERRIFGLGFLLLSRFTCPLERKQTKGILDFPRHNPCLRVFFPIC